MLHSDLTLHESEYVACTTIAALRHLAPRLRALSIREIGSCDQAELFSAMLGQTALSASLTSLRIQNSYLESFAFPHMPSLRSLALVDCILSEVLGVPEHSSLMHVSIVNCEELSRFRLPPCLESVVFRGIDDDTYPKVM